MKEYLSRMAEGESDLVPGTRIPNEKRRCYLTGTQILNISTHPFIHNWTSHSLPSLWLLQSPIYQLKTTSSFSCSGQILQRRVFLPPLASNLSGHSVDTTFQINPKPTDTTLIVGTTISSRKPRNSLHLNIHTQSTFNIKIIVSL